MFLSLDYHVGECIVEATESCIDDDPKVWSSDLGNDHRSGRHSGR